MPRRFKQTKSFQDRLSEFIEDARSAANAARDGADELVKKIQKAQTAADIEAWRKRRSPTRQSSTRSAE